MPETNLITLAKKSFSYLEDRIQKSTNSVTRVYTPIKPPRDQQKHLTLPVWSVNCGTAKSKISNTARFLEGQLLNRIINVDIRN